MEINKSGGIKTSLFTLLIAFLVVFGTAVVVFEFVDTKDSSEGSSDMISGNSVKVANEKNTIRLPDSLKDVPNEEQGTLEIWTKPPIKVFDQFVDSRNYIVFFTANNIKGLRIVYNLETKEFEAGSPIIKSPAVDIFDDNPHQIIYTYHRGQNQALFIDGVQVSSSEFKPIQISSVTGFVVRDFEDISEIDISGIEVSVYDREVIPQK